MTTMRDERSESQGMDTGRRAAGHRWHPGAQWGRDGLPSRPYRISAAPADETSLDDWAAAPCTSDVPHHAVPRIQNQPGAGNPPAEFDIPQLRVLVVDDNIDSASSMALLLSLDGHQVKTAFDGFGALDLADQFQPDAVLLDIGLPGMDGYEVARRLRARPTLRRALMIAITGYGQETDRALSKAAGFDHHLVKPVDPETLCALLYRLSPA